MTKRVAAAACATGTGGAVEIPRAAAAVNASTAPIEPRRRRGAPRRALRRPPAHDVGPRARRRRAPAPRSRARTPGRSRLPRYLRSPSLWLRTCAACDRRGLEAGLSHAASMRARVSTGCLPLGNVPPCPSLPPPRPPRTARRARCPRSSTPSSPTRRAPTSPHWPIPESYRGAHVLKSEQDMWAGRRVEGQGPAHEPARRRRADARAGARRGVPRGDGAAASTSTRCGRRIFEPCQHVRAAGPPGSRERVGQAPRPAVPGGRQRRVGRGAAGRLGGAQLEARRPRDGALQPRRRPGPDARTTTR